MSKEVKLINGEFTAKEANDVVNALLKSKINFHKLSRLSITEGDVNAECKFDNNRIDELNVAKEDMITFFNALRSAGKKVKMSATIHIEEI